MKDYQKPLVTVIMSVYNVEKYIGEAIESILTQTFSDFEFIIVDDGSTDCTPALVRTFAERDSRIRAIPLSRNLGTGAARNVGIAAARGAYITWMDGDDVSLPERLEKQLAFLRANPDIGVVGTCAIKVDQDLTPYGVWDAPEKHAHIAYYLLLGRPVLCSSLMIRRDILNAVGGFEETGKRGNDIELVSRLICRARFYNLPENLYMYRRNDSQTFSAQKAKRDYAELMARLLTRLWGEAPQASLDRFLWLKRREKLGPLERRRARRDLLRYIDGMVAANWVQESDRAFLVELAKWQLEWTTPRLWQKFCWWRRHHFGGKSGRRVPP